MKKGAENTEIKIGVSKDGPELESLGILFFQAK